MSRTLGEVASLVRSKNAGPFWLTIDVFLANREDYAAATSSQLTNPGFLSQLYGVDGRDVEIFTLESLNAIKVSFPRPLVQGSLHDADLHAGQQYVPLLEILL